jgi:hypothetical protein
MGHMHENAARALQYYEDLPRRSGRPELRLVDSEPRTRRRMEAELEPHVEAATGAAPQLAADGPMTGELRRPRDRHATRPHEQRAREPEHRAARPRPRPRREPRRQPLAPPRPQPAAPRLAGRPDRVAMWAVLLGFFLTAVAAATGHG